MHSTSRTLRVVSMNTVLLLTLARVVLRMCICIVASTLYDSMYFTSEYAYDEITYGELSILSTNCTTHKYFNFIPFTYDVTTLDATSTHG